MGESYLPTQQRGWLRRPCAHASARHTSAPPAGHSASARAATMKRQRFPHRAVSDARTRPRQHAMPCTARAAAHRLVLPPLTMSAPPTTDHDDDSPVGQRLPVAPRAAAFSLIIGHAFRAIHDNMPRHASLRHDMTSRHRSPAFSLSYIYCGKSRNTTPSFHRAIDAGKLSSLPPPL